jgi:hypothetical protein
VSTENRNSAEIRAEIEETRRKLGDTVTALAAKTDVKGRVKAKSAKAKEWAGAQRSRLPSGGGGASSTTKSDALERVKAFLREHQVPLAAAAAAFIGGLLLGRRHNRW